MVEQDDDPRARPPRLAVLTEQFLTREQAEDEALAWAQLEQEQAAQVAPAPRRPGRLTGRGRRRLLPLGAAVGVVILAVVFAALQLHGTSRALADPSQAAAAAQSAGTFTFTTVSELLSGRSPSTVSRSKGEVDLAGQGAFRVRVQGGLGVGFERVVFPAAVYFRGIGRHGARAWLGAHLAPPASITVHTPSGGGFGDPLGLLAVLAKTRHAQRLGVERVRGELTQHYRLRFTLGAFLAAEGQAAQPTVASLPVTVDVWQDRENQLLRAVRTFHLPARGGEQLVVRSEFGRYGAPTAIRAPAGVTLVGSQRLSPLADDPLGASVLGTVTFGTEHTGTAVPSRGHRRVFHGASSRQAGGPSATP